MALWDGESRRDRAKVSVDGVRMPRDCRSSASVWSGCSAAGQIKLHSNGTTGTRGRTRALAEPARLMNPTAPDAPRARWHTEHAVGLSCRLIGPRCTIGGRLMQSGKRSRLAAYAGTTRYWWRSWAISWATLFSRARSRTCCSLAVVCALCQSWASSGRGRGTTNSARICR